MGKSLHSGKQLEHYGEHAAIALGFLIVMVILIFAILSLLITPL